MKEITIYFVSGRDFTCLISDDALSQAMKDLQSSWSITTLTSEYGINREHITHFIIKKVT